MGRAKKSVEVEAQVIARGNVVPMMTETESEETVQYVSDEDAAREDRLVSEIRMITEQTKQVVLFNSIEIGRRLTEAKAMVKRGTWGTWLKERVDYSQRTANNFMKIYQEYGRNGLAEKSQALANLSYTQAFAFYDAIVLLHKALQEEMNMGRMWRGGYRRFHPIGDRMGNEMVDAFDVGQPICDLDMKYGVYKVPAKEVIPYRIYPVLSPAWKADGYDELGIIYDRYLDLLVTYVVEGESETDGYAAAIVTYDNLDTFGLPRGKLFEYASRNLKSDIRIGFTGTTGQLAMLEIGRLSGGVGGASALLLSSVWESAAKLFGTEKIIFFALSNCELMAVVAEERIIHALKSGLFDAARESVPVEEYFPKSIYGLVPDKSGYSLHRF